MPCKNTIRVNKENGIYHVYNRGVEKRDIFLDDQDYKTFMYFLKEYLLHWDDPLRKNKIKQNGQILVRPSFFNRIEIWAFCLMPNHFHLLLKQISEKDMADFMKCLLTSYSMYFNDKYDRVGSLFQGRYKAVLVEGDEYLLHVSRYMHTNPPYQGQTLVEYDWSSYQDYLGLRNTKWVKTGLILNIFNENTNNAMVEKQSYRGFVEESDYDSEEFLGTLVLE